MNNRKASHWVLLVIFIASFAIHALSFWLPAVPSSRQDLFRDEDGEPYLTEMDSYFYLRLAETMAEEGRILPFDQRLRGERPVESSHISGNPILLSTLTFCIWKALSLLFPVTVIQVARWIGPAFGSLAAVPVFFYVRRRTNLLGASVAAVLSALAVPFVAHSFSGFFDTDCLLAVVPLCFVTAHLTAMQEDRFARQAVTSLLGGLFFGILSMTWTAYYTYFWLMILGGFISGILLLFVRSAWGRRLAALRGFGMTAGFSLLFLFLFRSSTGVKALGDVFAIFQSVSGTGSSSAFPFTHQYTQEMLPLAGLPDVSADGVLSLLQGGTGSVLSMAGGLIPCLMAALWLPLGILACKKTDRHETPADGRRADPVPFAAEAGILLLWLAAGVKLALGSRRFAEIVVLPLPLLAGLAVGFLSDRMHRKEIPHRRILAGALALCTCAATVSASVNVTLNNVPSVSDPLAQAMAWVRENEPDNAVVASWWDDGYYMQYASRRRAPADGGTSSGVVYWFLGKALLTDDPALMTGLFRMLETSSVRSVSMLRSKGFTDSEAADLLCRTVVLSREAADRLLSVETGLSAEERIGLLDLTHPEETVPLLLSLNSDLLSKPQTLSWYGHWDLETKKQGSVSYIRAFKASQPAAPGNVCSFEMNGFNNPLQIRILEDSTPEIIDGPPGLVSDLHSMSLWENGECLLERELTGSGSCLVLVRENGRLCGLICSPDLKDSMLIRLLVCGEEGIPGVTQIGTWYGDTGDDPCLIQSLLSFKDPGAWGTRLWRLEE